MFEEMVNTLGLHEVIFGMYFLGMFSDMLICLFQGLSEFLLNCSWLVNDYRKIIYKNLMPYDVDDFKEKRLIAEVHELYNEKEKIKKKRNEFFKKIFKRK